MSQQKDSNQGVDLDKPTDVSADEGHPESSSDAGGTPETAVSGESGTVTETKSDAAADDSEAVGESDTEVIATDGSDTEVIDSDAVTTVSGKPGGRGATAESDSAAGESEAAAGFDTRKAVTLSSIALLVVAAVAAAWFGGTWIVGGYMHDRPRAEARDAALTDARQAAMNLMSFNPDDVDGSLKNMISSTTGDLHDEQTKDLDSLKQQVTDAKTRMESTVEGSSLTSLNSERDHAGAFVVLKITRSWPGTQPATFLQSWTLDMVKVGDTWKAEKAQNLGEPVQLNSGQPAAAPPSTTAPQPSTPPQPGN
ncbi:MAG: hypothetical protein JWN03_6954 [Nocardia sp.]|uniref:hypothetical protein n=1 Tax=Nocardia sp. TaxID=1821 RepID=UPI0026313FEB|nr:hypothetical protein [Nocardia sp.]MCU1646679.1 hypothetical protein [Nocardia sp.]